MTDADDLDPPAAPALADARSLGSFSSRYEAEITWGRLTSEGIDARIVAVNRRGPWRVVVPSGDEARSREVLSADHSALLDELFGPDPEAALPAGTCPRCAAPDAIDLQKEPGILLQLMGRPFWASRWRCRACKHRWR